MELENIQNTINRKKRKKTERKQEGQRNQKKTRSYPFQYKQRQNYIMVKLIHIRISSRIIIRRIIIGWRCQDRLGYIVKLNIFGTANITVISAFETIIHQQ